VLTRFRREHVGFVFQFYNLIPSLTARENVALVTEIAEAPMPPDEALRLVGLGARLDHFPAQLSGGEQQRVAIARALVIKPAIVLADEPTGNLDRANGRAVMDLLADLNERLAVTILLVTHDPVFAAMAKRVLRLVDGTLEQTMAFDDDDAALPASERGLAG
jgi:putative ABC transport system ATP-binding protein